MYTLDTKKILKKSIMVYVYVTIFCIVFNYIYSIFGHGIKSNYMKYAFVIPLILGVLVFYICYKLNLYNRISFNLYNAGIVTLIVGSILKGILYIAGTDETYYKAYFIIGIILIILAIIKLVSAKFVKIIH